jgi:hypothetical protein
MAFKEGTVVTLYTPVIRPKTKTTLERGTVINNTSDGKNVVLLEDMIMVYCRDSEISTVDENQPYEPVVEKIE